MVGLVPRGAAPAPRGRPRTTRTCPDGLDTPLLREFLDQLEAASRVVARLAPSRHGHAAALVGDGAAQPSTCEAQFQPDGGAGVQYGVGHQLAEEQTGGLRLRQRVAPVVQPIA